MFTAILLALRSRRHFALVAGALLAYAPTYAIDTGVTKVPKSAPIQMMILGSYYMGNPGLDQVNVEADDVTLPKRLNAKANSLC